MKRLRGAVPGDPQTDRALTTDAPCGMPGPGVDECPPLAYSGRVDQELVQELQKIWVRLEDKARGAKRRTEVALPIMEHVLLEASW
jgi:hypothetical protein